MFICFFLSFFFVVAYVPVYDDLISNWIARFFEISKHFRKSVTYIDVCDISTTKATTTSTTATTTYEIDENKTNKALPSSK